MKTFVKFIVNQLHVLYKENMMDFLCVLLRVKGMESYARDPFSKFESILKRGASETELKSILEHRDFVQFLCNIALIANGQSIQLFFSGRFFDGNNQLFLKKNFLAFLSESKFPNPFKSKLMALYSDKLSGSQKRTAKKFLSNFFSAIKEIRKQTVVGELLYKQPQFETLELLKDSRNLLNGFRLHFSNGNVATYKRGSRMAEAINLCFQEESINFFVGDLGSLERSWKFEGDYLYKRGLRRRYNNFGEWKPLQTHSSNLDFDILAEQVSSHEDVRDVARYAIFTSCYSIEFFFLTKIKVEEKDVAFGDILLHRCDATASDNEYIYDGNIFFNSLDEDEILRKMQVIEDAKLKLEFIYGDDVKWRLKYTLASHQSGSTIFDLKSFKKFYEATGSTLSNRHIEGSMDWYLKGTGSRNKFNAYLCYAISIERLAIQIYDDPSFCSDARISLDMESAEERMARLNSLLNSCFQDPTKLEDDIERLYSEKKSLTFKLKHVFGVIFGTGSVEFKKMFEGNKSLYSLRHKLAHGDFIERDRETYSLIKTKIFDIRNINRQFILEVIRGVSGRERIPKVRYFKNLHSNMQGPQNVACVSDIYHPSFRRANGWKIEREWVLEAFDS